MSPKEKGKFEDMAKQDKLRYEAEMKNYIPPKGQKMKRFKDPNAPKRPPWVHFELTSNDVCAHSVYAKLGSVRRGLKCDIWGES